MTADVISVAIVGFHFFRGHVSIDRMWRRIYPLGRHLSVVAFSILLQIEAQNVLLNAYYAG